MRLPLGIDIDFSAAGAISNLTRLAERLSSLGGTPARMASAGLQQVAGIGETVTQGLVKGFDDARASWYSLGGALGVPVSIAGVLSVATGIHSLKDTMINANAELETNKVRMSSLLRDFNDSDRSADMKGGSLVAMLRKYAIQAPFSTQSLIEGAATLSQNTKSPQQAFEMTKVAGRLAALRGTSDIGWAAQSLNSALNGNTASLRESFGINVNDDMLASMALMTSAGNTRQGKYLALVRMIEQKTGGKDSDIVGKLSRTGAGAMTTLRDELSIPITDMATPMYDRLVKSLVTFNDAFGHFLDSDGFKRLQTLFSDRLLSIGNRLGTMFDYVSGNLDKIPAAFQKFEPAIMTVMKVVGGLAAVNLGMAAIRATIGGGLMVLQYAGTLLAPIASIVANPLLVAGLLALSAAMWPTAKSLEVGGKSLDTWLTGVEKWSGKTDWVALFTKPLEALRKLFDGDYSKGIVFDWGRFFNDSFDQQSLPGRIAHNVLGPMLSGFKSAFMTTFPELTPIIDTFSAHWKAAMDVLAPYMPIIRGLTLALGALGVVGRLTGLGSGLAVAGRVAAGGARLGAGVMAVGAAAAANPLAALAIAGGAAIAGTLAYPFIKDKEVGGKKISEWVDMLRGTILGGVYNIMTRLEAVDWKGIGDRIGGEVHKWADFFQKLDWDQVGVKMAAGIRSAISQIGTALHAGTLWKTFSDYFKAIDWEKALSTAWSDVAGVSKAIFIITGKIIHGLVEGLGNLFPDLKKQLMDTWDSVVFAFDEIGKTLDTLMKPIMEGLGGQLNGGGGGGIGLLKALWNGFEWVLWGVLKVIQVVAAGVGDFFLLLNVAAQSDIGQAALKGLGMIIGWLLNPFKALGDAWKRLGEWSDAVTGGIKAAWHEVQVDFMGIVTSVMMKITEWRVSFNHVSNEIRAAFGKAWDWIVSKLELGADKFRTVAASIGLFFQPVVDLFSRLWLAISNVGDKAVALGTSLKDFFKDLPQTVGSFLTAIPDKISAMWANLPSGFSSILQWISGQLTGPDTGQGSRGGDGTGGSVSTGGPSGTGNSDYGGGAEGAYQLTPTGGVTHHYDMSGMQAPVTVYAQDGAMLDSATLMRMLMENMQPMVRKMMEDAVTGRMS